MTITNASSGTNVVEIADGIFRINTPLEIPGDRSKSPTASSASTRRSRFPATGSGSRSTSISSSTTTRCCTTRVRASSFHSCARLLRR
jgi:hypothetical protein